MMDLTGYELETLRDGGELVLSRAGQLVNNATFQPFKIFGVVALVYFLICFPLSRLSRRLERVLHVGRPH